MLDLVLTDAEVHDGLGSPPVRTSIGIQEGRIAAVNPDPGPARHRLDLDGLVLAPGFIDSHSHADLILMQEPGRARALLEGRLGQGITTAIIGNCGMGAAPVSRRTEPVLRGLGAWMTPEDVDWPWSDLGSYLDELERRELPLNVGALQPHGPLRLEAIGPDVARAGERALDRMRERVREAMRAGALGLSAGLIYAPGMYADTDELVALAAEVRPFDGVFACHLRGSSELLLPSVEELLEIGRRTSCRVVHSHCEAVGPDHWDRIPTVLQREEAARKTGVDVGHDLFPYHAAATLMAALFPPHSLSGGLAGLLEQLRDPAARERLRAEISSQVPSWPPWTDGGWPHNLVRAVGWGSIRIASLPPGAPSERIGMDLAEVARRRGCDPFDALADLMLQHDGKVGQLLFGITGSPENEEPMSTLIKDPHGAICTDAEDVGRGLPHPAAYGAFPRVLGTWVRERRLVSLPEAIRRMTSLPADRFRIRGRGRIAPGYAADLVAFSPERIEDRAEYFSPRTPPVGIERVFVNGVAVTGDGFPTGTAPGQVVRR